MAVSCNKLKENLVVNGSPETEHTGLQYVKTELGGCNVKNDLMRSDSDIERDTVIITFSGDSVSVNP